MSGFAGWKSEMATRQANMEKALIRLADGMNDLRDKIDEVKDNHLAHMKNQIDDNMNDLKKTHIIPIYDKLEKVNLKVHQRPTWVLTAVIGSLLSLCTGLIMWVATH